MSNEPSSSFQIGDILTEKELKSLMDAVSSRKAVTSVHNAIMAWLDKQPEVLNKMRELGILKAFCAYALEYVLELQ